MVFLRLLHVRASQKFTYFCINAAGWYNTETRSHDDALKFMGDNEFEFTGSNLKQKDVPFDGCRVSKNARFHVNSLLRKNLNKFKILVNLVVL